MYIITDTSTRVTTNQLQQGILIISKNIKGQVHAACIEISINNLTDELAILSEEMCLWKFLIDVLALTINET